MCAEVPPDARGRRRPLRRVSVSKVILKVQVRAGSLHPRLVPVQANAIDDVRSRSALGPVRQIGQIWLNLRRGP